MYHLILFPHTERPRLSSPVKSIVSVSFSQSCPAKTINPFSSSPSSVKERDCFSSAKRQCPFPSAILFPFLKKTCETSSTPHSSVHPHPRESVRIPIGVHTMVLAAVTLPIHPTNRCRKTSATCCLYSVGATLRASPLP